MIFDHRRRWSALLAGEPDIDGFLHRVIGTLLRPGSGAAAVVRGDLAHMIDGRGRLMFSALLRKGATLAVLAAYPYTESPFRWPLALQKIEESQDRTEGRLLGACHGAQVALYDTLYLKNRDRYRPGETLTPQVSALAYQLEADELPPNFAPDFTGFGLLQMSRPDAEPEEVVFHSPIQGAEEVSFWGVPVRRYQITLATPGDFPMSLELYASHATAARPFAVGERVRGVAWLFSMVP
jgi:hypothetical protein